MFRRIQNESLKKDCIWVRIRGAFLAKKGAPKLDFHREGGGQLPPSAPPKSATGPGLTRLLQIPNQMAPQFHKKPNLFCKKDKHTILSARIKFRSQNSVD